LAQANIFAENLAKISAKISPGGALPVLIFSRRSVMI
jgi:hypothetical protein